MAIDESLLGFLTASDIEYTTGPGSFLRAGDNPMTTEDVTLAISEGVATITMNRPDAGNALTTDQRLQMMEWIERANEDASIRCVVIGATGRFFCTGADLRSGSETSVAPAADGTPEPLVGDIRRQMLRGAISFINAVIDCEKPVIASVPGTAAGIGAHLAFACDLVVAADTAKFIEVFARRGIACDGLGTWLLPRLVGLQRAKELVLLAEDLSATRAQEIGLVSRVVPPDQLDATVAGLARRLATGPTRAHSVNKWLLNRSLDLDRHTMADDEAWVVELLAHTDDRTEGVTSFVERRPANFKGY
jgi:2-(1,2-epoxy-1,2-dihydrophenyl)acetyl-CoA isomerase